MTLNFFLEKAFEWLKADLSKNEKAKKNIDEIATGFNGVIRTINNTERNPEIKIQTLGQEIAS